MEKKLESKLIYQGKIFKIKKDKVILPDASISERDIVEHNGGCAIMIVDKTSNSVFLVKQYRYALQETLIELPAGKIDPGEGHFETAMREAQEEVGVIPNKLEYLGVFYPTCGYSSEKIHLYYCDDYEVLDHLDLDEGEFLEPIRININEVYEKVLSGEIKDGKTIIAIMKYYAMKR